MQPNEDGSGTPPAIAPFRLNTVTNFAVMRVEGTPHGWADAQAAWNQGLMSAWPKAKHNHSLGPLREGRPALPMGAVQRLHAVRRLPLLFADRHQHQPPVPVDRHE